MKIIYLPTDDRPYCFGSVRRFISLVPLDVRIPERGLLGNRWHGADLQKLSPWLWTAVAGGDTLVLSLDALLYGGLVQGREATSYSDRVDAACKLLKELRQRIGPTGKLYVFFVWKRLWGNISSVEDLSKMRTAEEISSRLEEELVSRSASLPVFLRMLRRGARIPAGLDKEEVVQLAAFRASQRQDLLAVLDLEPEVLDHVHLAREDNSGRGLYGLEVQSLIAEAKQRRVRISSTEGGDEAGMLMLTMAINQLAPQTTCGFSFEVSSKENWNTVPPYEGRPFGETIQALRILTTVDARDLVKFPPQLYLNLTFTGEIQPGDPLLTVLRGQLPAPLPPESYVTRAVPTASISRREIRVDLTYANGVNEDLVNWFIVESELPLLVFQSGTTANRIGYSLFAATAAKFALQHKVPDPSVWQRLAEVVIATYIEEVLYSGHLRSWAISRWKGMGPTDDATLITAEKELSEAAFAIARRKFSGFTFLEHPVKLESVQLHLPWKRWFEAEAEVKVTAP